MQQSCKQCQAAFEITSGDLAFYEKVSPVFAGKKELIPPPTLCPDCRQQRRLAFRNERHLYRNRCGLTGEAIITNVSPDKPYPAYTRAAWLGDGWDAQTFALEPEGDFLAQVGLLLRRVPRWGNYVENCENCDFCINSYNGKDSYLTVSAGDFEQCLYSLRVLKARRCVDCTNLLQGELCYECVDCENLHSCSFLQNCKQCQRCDHCLDCSACQDCLLCAGLRRKQYCIRNEQCTKDEYERKREELLRVPREELQRELARVALTVPHVAQHLVSCENVEGDFCSHAKNLTNAFFVTNTEDSAYVYDSDRVTLCVDASNADYYTQCYDVSSAAWINRSAFCDNSIYLADCFYCCTCAHLDHCFGCVGLKRKQYCILNKQYTKDEYERIVPTIIVRMKKDERVNEAGSGSWGEYFATQFSPFAYNESAAQEYFPLAKEQVLERGWQWREQTDDMPNVSKTIPAEKLPDSIDDIPDDILHWAIRCEVSKRPFKIIKQELEFYREQRLPIPHLHPDERHKRRMALRNPRKLWTRKCAKCGKEIQTTYPPDRPEIVYCERCYLETVY